MSKLLCAIIVASFFLSSMLGNEVMAQSKHSKPKPRSYSEAQVEQIIKAAAAKGDVPPHLLLAICWIETSYKQPKIPEPLDGTTPSYGICQVKLGTAQMMDLVYHLHFPATVERLRDPYVNAFYAAKYLNYQLKQYDGDWKKAVAAYNQGSWYIEAPNVKYVSKVQDAIDARGLASN